MLSFDIRGFIDEKQGATEKLDFDQPVTLAAVSDLGLHGNISGHIKLLKLPHEINVQMSDLKVSCSATCSRCLKKFEYEVKVPFAEREFIIDLPEEDVGAKEEVYYVNTDRNMLQLDGMLSEEIRLHFPHIPVCSEGCKGLCVRCGKNLNEGLCKCPREDSQASPNPFKFLK